MIKPLEPDEFASAIRLTPLVSIDLIVYVGDKVLLGRRVHEPAKGFLFVPGGRILKNETLDAAFLRITRKELGIPVTRQRASFFGLYDHIYSTNALEQPGFGTHYVVLAHKLHHEQLRNNLPLEQHSDYKLMTPAEIVDSNEVHVNTRAYFQ